MNLHRQNVPVWLAWALSLLLAGAMLARPALGGERTIGTKLLDKQTTVKVVGLADPDSHGAFNVKIGDNDINVDAEDTRQGNVYVAKGDTVNDDLVTRGGSITVDGVVQGDCAALGGSIAINGSVTGDVAAFGGSVTVADKAVVGGSIASFGGSVDIMGRSEDVACFGGSVSLGPTAKVDGDVASMGGTVDRKPGAEVSGEIKNISFGMLDQFIPGAIHNIDSFHRPPRPRPMARAMGFVGALLVAAGIGLLVLLTSLFFPRQVEKVAAAVQDDFWTSAGVGMLIQMALFPGLVLMVVSILGIPLVPVAVMLLLGALLTAYAAIGLVVFRKLARDAAPGRYGTAAAAMLGYLMLNVLYLAASLLRIVPHTGFIAGLFIAINVLVTWFGLTLGLGAVWRTRFGTRSAALPVPPATPAPPAQVESGSTGIA
ncbi:MAG: polymer-forming cytoskeletal protein [Candidatus Edwardsbacteria bacterium]|jgi:hypothetical protein|nr:polymer-forming cytoskeletal protein [Candidatus Edwardsbacteria bacterium]